MKISLLYFLSMILITVSCNQSTDNKSEKEKKNDDVKVSYIYQNDETFNAIKKQGAIIVKQTEVALGSALKNALAEGGPEYAIDFCNLQALKITDSLASQDGVVIRRLAKKNRNPVNETNDVESKIYKQYVMEYLTGAPIVPKVSVDKNGHPVYYKLIKVNSMCLTCHGTPGETMSADLASKIKELYPEDKATNFKDGHPRGMWAVTFTKLNINTDK